MLIFVLFAEVLLMLIKRFMRVRATGDCISFVNLNSIIVADYFDYKEEIAELEAAVERGDLDAGDRSIWPEPKLTVGYAVGGGDGVVFVDYTGRMCLAITQALLLDARSVQISGDPEPERKPAPPRPEPPPTGMGR